MPTMVIAFRDRREFSAAFDDVADAWGLSASERQAVLGVQMRGGHDRSRHSRFVTERMASVIAISALLGSMMDEAEVRLWLRRSLPGVFGGSPLEDMFGSTDRLRRMQALLELEARD